jgi:hypothetical protein
VTALSQVREILERNYFPTTIDLRIQTHIAVWSDHYFITKPLFDLLPFGQTLAPVTFYQYIDYQLPNLVEQASNNLLYWNISGTQQLTEKLPRNLPYFLTTPSSGIITSPPNTRKSRRAYTTGTEYDLYPDFICWKPKSKWNLMKFDFSRTQENDLNWCILTVRNTPTSGPHSSGTLQFETLKPPLSIPESLPSLFPCQTLWEEMPNTRNNLIRYWNKPTTFSLVPSTGILWIVPKQNPDQAVPSPPSSSPHHLRLGSQFASVESIFAGAITDPTRLPLPLTLSCGNLLRSCNPEEEYITCITTALQNLAHRSRMAS